MKHPNWQLPLRYGAGIRCCREFAKQIQREGLVRACTYAQHLLFFFGSDAHQNRGNHLVCSCFLAVGEQNADFFTFEPAAERKTKFIRVSDTSNNSKKINTNRTV